MLIICDYQRHLRFFHAVVREGESQISRMIAEDFAESFLSWPGFDQHWQMQASFPRRLRFDDANRRDAGCCAHPQIGGHDTLDFRRPHRT